MKLEWKCDPKVRRRWIADGEVALYQLDEWELINRPSAWTLTVCRFADNGTKTISGASKGALCEAAQEYEDNKGIRPGSNGGPP